MLGSKSKIVSPSRTYVAMCNNGNFDGHYFRKFTLPARLADCPEYAKDLCAVQDIQSKNNADFAAWYFLNVLDYVACIDGCITFEDYSNIKDVAVIEAELAAMVSHS